MCFEKHSPFTRMLLGSLIASVIGIAAGLVFGLLITFIAHLFAGPALPVNTTGPLATYQFPAFFGMAFGAIIGAILGGISANKK